MGEPALYKQSCNARPMSATRKQVVMRRDRDIN